MPNVKMKLALILIAVPFSVAADASLECSVNVNNQVEISDCVAETEATVDKALQTTLGFAMDAAIELDKVTGRDVAVPALNASQSAWSAYRDAQCEYVGSTFGGGSGTSIAIRSCRVELGRDRTAELMQTVR